MLYVVLFLGVYYNIVQTYLYCSVHLICMAECAFGLSYQKCVSGIGVVSQLLCVDQLNPTGLISVRATLPIYLIDQVSSVVSMS